MNIGVEVLKESVIRVQSQLNDWMDCRTLAKEENCGKNCRPGVI